MVEKCRSCISDIVPKQFRMFSMKEFRDKSSVLFEGSMNE